MHNLAIVILPFFLFGCHPEEPTAEVAPSYYPEKIAEWQDEEDEREDGLQCKNYQHLVWYKDYLSEDSKEIQLEVGKDIVLRPGFQILDSDVLFELKDENAFLPAGLTINKETGEIYGIPVEAKDDLQQAWVQYRFDGCTNGTMLGFRVSMPKKAPEEVLVQLEAEEVEKMREQNTDSSDTQTTEEEPEEEPEVESDALPNAD